jgi:hypothetical protein
VAGKLGRIEGHAGCGGDASEKEVAAGEQGCAIVHCTFVLSSG